MTPKPVCVARPLLLDLFCGAGGAAMGYHRAGFDIVGVDIRPQPRYPFRFLQGDALDALKYLWHLDTTLPHAIHASPPCHDHSKRLAGRWGRNGTGFLLDATRGILSGAGVPWMIENVAGADMRPDYRLCGCMFDLPGLRRERWFEVSWPGPFRQPDHRPHTGHTITVTGHAGGTSSRDGKTGRGSTADWKRAMGIDWMTGRELTQAIPPPYTEYVGRQLMAVLS